MGRVTTPLIAGRGPPSRCSMFLSYSDLCVDVVFLPFQTINKKGFKLDLLPIYEAQQSKKLCHWLSEFSKTVVGFRQYKWWDVE